MPALLFAGTGGVDWLSLDQIPTFGGVTAAALAGTMKDRPMGVTIEIDAPELLPQLVERLEAGGCSAQRISPRACRVVHLEAVDADEAFCELRFFAHAWAARHGGVAVSLRPDA